MQIAICEGYIVTVQTGPLSPMVCSASEGVVEVSGTWHIVEYPLYFETSMIDPIFAMSFFVGGWFVFMTPWVVAFGFGRLLEVIKRF